MPARVRALPRLVPGAALVSMPLVQTTLVPVSLVPTPLVPVSLVPTPLVPVPVSLARAR